MKTEERKICARALERFLIGFEIFETKKDFSMLFYSSDTDMVGSRNHKTHENLDKEVLIRKYQKHIPECPECRDTYIGFLNSVKKNNQSIEDMDKKYLGLLPKITSSTH